MTMWILAYIAEEDQRIEWHCSSIPLHLLIWVEFLSAYIYKY